MRLKLTLATASALGLLMGGAALAGDNNKTFSVQDGDSNALSVDQDGNSNSAGVRTDFNEYLKQDGNNNSMDIDQVGDNNKVARTGPSNSGAFQTGNLNKLTITQTSFDYSHNTNGHVIDRIRQKSSDDATGNVGDTNTAAITQRGSTAVITGQGPSAGHYIGVINQTHTTGAANSLTIDQAGAYSAWYGTGGNPGAGSALNNQIGTVTQNGSSNTATLNQDGTGPVQSTSGPQQRGPANTIRTVDQQGSGHYASVTQNGFQNYVEQVRQSDLDNSATISLTGDGNGATRPGNRLAGLLVGGAGAAGALASSVVQGGGSLNQVEYTVLNGDDNQFGFNQYGNGNQALGILITGGRNQLGVSQTGDNNMLLLAAISGSDNVIGLTQDGTDNVADVTVTGDRNVGYNNFTGGPAGDLALSASLTPGLLEQSGTFNQVALTVDGSDNVFASLQDNSTLPSAGAWNVIVATQNGSSNQAAVVQAGNNNTTNLTQTGGMNNASINQ